MSEPIHSTPGSPGHRFRFTLRGMMFAVAVTAVLFSLWIPTIQLLAYIGAWILAFLLFLEAIVVYYVALAGIIARGVVKKSDESKRIRRLLIFAPVILFFALFYINLLADTLLKLPWM